MSRKFKDVEWNIAEGNGNIGTWEKVAIAVLMDIRDEMKAHTTLLSSMSRILNCPNFTAIPTTLRSIRRNTAKPKPKKRKA